MIALKADFNHRDQRGRLRLEDLRMHANTPFSDLVGRGDHFLFIDGEDVVRGELVRDPELGWLGQADWSTLEIWEEYPATIGG